MSEAQAGASTPVETPVAANTATPAPEPTAGQEAVQTPEPTQEKMLTQSEVNKLVAAEKAKAARRAERIASERAEALYYKRLYEQSQQPQQRESVVKQPTD